MKKKLVTILLAVSMVSTFAFTGCSKSEESEATESSEDADQKAADEVAALIDAIYVQERTEETDEQCK